MIKVNKESIVITGSVIEIQSEISMLANKLVEQHIMSKESIIYSVELGCKSKEELDEEFAKSISRLNDSEVDKLVEDFIKSMSNITKEGREK